MTTRKCRHIWSQIGWALDGQVLAHCKCGTLRAGDTSPFRYYTHEYIVIDREPFEENGGIYGRRARRHNNTKELT